MENCKIIDCTGNSLLASKISKKLNCPIAESVIETFNDGEISIQILENMRGVDVYVIQSLNFPVNDNFMKLLLTIDALERASSNSINLVCPYLCYSRQDRKAGPRTPISAKVIADMLYNSGADRLLTMDLHSNQIQGFYKIPVDNLYGSIVFKPFLKERLKDSIHETVIVAPDVGAASRARGYSEYLDTPLVIVEKRRQQAGECEVMNVLGDVTHKNCIIVDDMLDTGGTVCNAANILKEKGATSLSIVITHGVFSKNAIEKLNESQFDKIYVSNTIDNTLKLMFQEKFEIVDMSDLLTETIKRIQNNESVSELFNVV